MEQPKKKTSPSRSPKFQEVYTTSPGDIWVRKTHAREDPEAQVDGVLYPKKVMILSNHQGDLVVCVLDLEKQSKMFLARHTMWMDYAFVCSATIEEEESKCK